MTRSTPPLVFLISLDTASATAGALGQARAVVGEKGLQAPALGLAAGAGRADTRKFPRVRRRAGLQRPLAAAGQAGRRGRGRGLRALSRHAGRRPGLVQRLHEEGLSAAAAGRMP
jgi:hypothetical protein